MTFEEMKNLPEEEQEKIIKELKEKRQKAKTTLYSATYGAFPPKIARSAGISIDEAKILWETYWKRNWAIKKIADACQTKELSDGSIWLYNPVSGLYYSLRFEKDKFSTLNQGTGSFCFDIWIGFVLSEREQLTAQFHDEGVWSVKKGHRKEMEDLLKGAIQKANNVLQLNRELDIGIQFGSDYGQIH